MRKDLERYVNESDEYQRRKQAHEYRAHLGEVLEPTYAFEITPKDIVGSLPLNNKIIK
jgi:hypothetical protein